MCACFKLEGKSGGRGTTPLPVPRVSGGLSLNFHQAIDLHSNVCNPIISSFKMLEVTCTGTPLLVGQQHGSAAKVQISRCIKFYQTLFLAKCKMDWETVKAFSLKYQPYLEANWPHYISELRGVAEGAGVTYEDILALNVRTEIAFGAFNDGCTAVSWKGEKTSILAQNWDWNTE
jgi:isopenicillin-N N-acyltransferase-like protein